MLVSDFFSLGGALQDFSELRMYSLINVIIISEIFSVVATLCLNMVFRMCLITSLS